MVIPTKKAVIYKSFICYVHILFAYVLTAYGCARKLQFTNRVNNCLCSSCGDIIGRSLQSFTLFIEKIWWTVPVRPLTNSMNMANSPFKAPDQQYEYGESPCKAPDQRYEYGSV